MPVRKKLTATVLAAAKPGETIWDTEDRKLLLRVSPKGVKAFLCKWHWQNTLALGKHPGMTLDMARRASLAAQHETHAHGAPLAVLKARGLGEREPLTLREFIDNEYAPWKAAKQKRGAEDVAGLKASWAELLSKPLAAIVSDDIEKLMVARRKGGATPATVNRDLNRLRGALSRAVDWGHLKAHPMRTVKKLKGADNSRVRYLTSAEEARLRAALAARESTRRASRSKTAKHYAHSKHRRRRVKPYEPEAFTDYLQPMVLLAMNCGLRRGELFAITWANINLPAKVLTVPAGIAKSSRTRHVPLSAEALAVLAQWKQQSGGDAASGLVFPGEDGGAMTSIKRSWSTLVAAAKITDLRFHDLRHDFASKLVRQGVSLYAVQKLLGHEDSETTARYAHLAPDNLVAAVAVLDKQQAVRK